MSQDGNKSDKSVFEMLVDGIRVVYGRRQSNVSVTKDHWAASRLADREHKDTPSVSFIRVSGRLQGTDRRGPHEFTTEDGSDTDLWFTALYEDVATVQCIVRGHDRCETERLWNDVLHAVRNTLGQMAVPTTYTWTTEEEDGAAHIQAGQHEVIQTFEWRILVPHDFGTLAQVNAIETDAEIQSQDGSSATADKTFTQTL